ncbi:hypothetical protein Pla144_30050 [Bythopirellula polymerisocia]|uniref:Polysaccharide biosynthesis protein n=2 Tax=Bythopirellula polymerisocia TaxID=2528003 RepID=A0A5C6CLM3_9BACT|nr:hypothetical protein Pla144_30050 [Bythopirellula polymerisocia]
MWGKELYGEWLLLSAIPSFIELANGGISKVACVDMIKATARKDSKRFQQIVQTTCTLILLITFPVAMLLLVASATPIDSYLPFSSIDPFEVRVITFTFVANFILMQLSQIYDGMYQSFLSFARLVVLSNIERLATAVVVIIFVLRGATPIGVALTMTIMQFLFLLARSYDIHNVAEPWARSVMGFGIRHRSHELVRSLFRPAISYGLLPLCNAIRGGGILWIIGYALNPAAVALFSALRTLANSGGMLLSVVTQSISPELTVAVTSENHDLARLIFRKALQVVVVSSIFFAIGLFCAGGWIFALWTNRELQFDNQVFTLLLCVVIAKNFWSSALVVATSSNRHTRDTVFVLLGHLVALSGALVLVPLIGLPGAAISLLVCDIVISVFVIRRALILLEESSWNFLASFSPSSLIQLFSFIKQSSTTANHPVPQDHQL